VYAPGNGEEDEDEEEVDSSDLSDDEREPKEEEDDEDDDEEEDEEEEENQLGALATGYIARGDMLERLRWLRRRGALTHSKQRFTVGTVAASYPRS
jgi:hypothetical protein